MSANLHGLANGAVARAISAGRLVRSSFCEACGGRGDLRLISNMPIHLHHWSYDREYWLDVIPLCVSCHRRVHYGAIPEPRTGRMYPRRADLMAARRAAKAAAVSK